QQKMDALGGSCLLYGQCGHLARGEIRSQRTGGLALQSAECQSDAVLQSPGPQRDPAGKKDKEVRQQLELLALQRLWPGKPVQHQLPTGSRRCLKDAGSAMGPL